MSCRAQCGRIVIMYGFVRNSIRTLPRQLRHFFPSSSSRPFHPISLFNLLPPPLYLHSVQNINELNSYHFLPRHPTKGVEFKGKMAQELKQRNIHKYTLSTGIFPKVSNELIKYYLYKFCN